ncbi:MAG: thioredoxin family protein [Prevotella sp.]|nr:thioredoxin family protein [Prevotella sp.]
MKKLFLLTAGLLLLASAAHSQELKKVYNEDINPLQQISEAVERAKAEGKFVVCQVGGNWCVWCLRFANFIENDSTISRIIDDNFVYIHTDYTPSRSAGEKNIQLGKALMQRLNNPARFGFPVFVVLDENGNVLHIQDSSFLEEGKGYDREKVLRFFRNWTPKAVGR